MSAEANPTENPVVEAILSRRSIRRYRPDLVSEGLVEALLESAMAAPSAGNQQAWQFVVVTDRKLLDLVPSCHPYAYMLPEAPLAVVVCADLTQVVNEGFWPQDCAAATENLLLAAHALGLGAVWLGVHPREERISGLRHLLGIPDHVVPVSLVAIGHPAESKAPARRYSPGRVHRNGW